MPMEFDDNPGKNLRSSFWDDRRLHPLVGQSSEQGRVLGVGLVQISEVHTHFPLARLLFDKYGVG